jgi:hypothetical protein
VLHRLCTIGTTKFGARMHRGFWFMKVFILFALLFSTIFVSTPPPPYPAVSTLSPRCLPAVSPLSPRCLPAVSPLPLVVVAAAPACLRALRA